MNCYSQREELVGRRTGGQALRSGLQKLPAMPEELEFDLEFNVVEDNCEPEVGYHRPGCSCNRWMIDCQVY